MSRSTSSAHARLRRRRRLVVGTILPALVLVVLAIRFLTLPLNMGSAQQAHGRDDGPAMVASAQKLHVLNLVERWRAPFVEGTGKSISGDLPGGRTDLEEALGRTNNPRDDCTVRTNLVITVSQQADAAKASGDTDSEQKLAKEGLALIEEGPKGCLDGTDDGNNGEAGRKQQEQKDKLEKQIGQEPEPDEPQDAPPDEPKDDAEKEDEEKDPQQKELEERNQTGQKEAEDNRRQDEEREKGNSGGVERPW